MKSNSKARTEKVKFLSAHELSIVIEMYHMIIGCVHEMRMWLSEEIEKPGFQRKADEKAAEILFKHQILSGEEELGFLRAMVSSIVTIPTEEGFNELLPTDMFGTENSDKKGPTIN